ncbi:uncharacterized protein LOC106876422 [Octopus bimaculoides]|uniref:Ig-like domain-containing protein n=1 Tax=Octopus bimaculoides TaxID=37653 RepID=A0A0L8GJQ3_OCTBM|nr:uncharacterized protein LOC106876422 [Octopus bimaculoides]|eukprot:XP_014780451.1 PREDICTED: uncharacterized protein LOC106876422 [Octopus bimaculoides]
MLSMNRLLLLIITFRLIKKSYLFTSPGRTYFSHVNGNVHVMCTFHEGDFLEQWVEKGPIATCESVHPVDLDGYKIEDINCTSNTASMKVTLLKIKPLSFICHTNACLNIRLTLMPLFNDSGNLEPAGGTKPRMQKKFTLNCKIGASRHVVWFHEDGELLMKYKDCHAVGGNSSRFSGRAHFSCDYSKKMSVLSFVPILLADGNFSIICITSFHGSEYSIRTRDTRKLTTSEVGTIYIQGDRTAKFMCPLDKGDSLFEWKGDNFTANCTGSYATNQLKFYAINITCNPESSTLLLRISHRVSKMEIYCDSYLKRRKVFKVATPEPTTGALGDNVEYVVVISLLILLLIILICFNSICFMTSIGRHYWIKRADLSETSVSSQG